MLEQELKEIDGGQQNEEQEEGHEKKMINKPEDLEAGLSKQYKPSKDLETGEIVNFDEKTLITLLQVGN